MLDNTYTQSILLKNKPEPIMEEFITIDEYKRRNQICKNTMRFLFIFVIAIINLVYICLCFLTLDKIGKIERLF